MKLNHIELASNKAKGGRPYFFDDPAVERVLNITMSLAGEVAVMRERMDTIERLLAEKGLLEQSEIDQFAPTGKVAEERQAWHAAFIARILRIVQQELEALKNPDLNKPMEQIADELADM